MFAIVRTGGKQYRVAPGDKIVVEKLAGNAGDSINLEDVLLAGEGSDLKSTSGLTVAAEIIAQAKGDKVIVFKKRRRHNYRRKAGHRQQHTILRIVAIGDQKEQKSAPKKAAAEKPAKAAPAAPAADETASAPAVAAAPAKIEGAESPMTDSPAPKKAKKETAKKEAAPKAAAKSEPTASEQTDSPAPKKKASTKKPEADKNA
jgi:large subunit ribosomal protein L21